MLSRCCMLIASAFLLLLVLTALPGAAAGPAPPSCGLLPWQGTVNASVNPLEPPQSQFLLKTSCTTSAQCSAGEACNCGQCHPACGTNQRWSCECQTCYNRCPAQYFFDESVCACAHI